MRQSDRFKLHGTCRTPRFRIGAQVRCEVRGELTINDMPEVVEKIRRPHIGAKRSAVRRQRMSNAWKLRGKLKPSGGTWRPWEDDLVLTRPVSEIVRWTGRTLSAIGWRKRQLIFRGAASTCDT